MLFLLELGVIGLIVVLQSVIFVRNLGQIRKLATLYPERDALRIQRVLIHPANEQDAETPSPLTAEAFEVDLIAAQDVSDTFAEIAEDTNTYLEYNKGTAADFNILKDISERKSEAEENAVQANIATPLYVGLLGTFLGVIIGLTSILFTGVEEASIQRFLVGVVIAMVGSFFGLLFTMFGNQRLKTARLTRDRAQNDYYTFLQSRLLPRLQSDMTTGLMGIRQILDAFNRDFLGRVSDFRNLFHDLADYVNLQQRFMQTLEQVGYHEMAEANLKVFDKLQETESLFQRFHDYQRSMNDSLERGKVVADQMTQIMGRLTQLDHLGEYLQRNDELLRKQLGYLSAHQDKMQSITDAIQQHFDEASHDIAKVVERRIGLMKKEEQDAGEMLRQHFSRLNQENVYEKMIAYLQPFQGMKEEITALRSDWEKTHRLLLNRMLEDSTTQKHILEQLEQFNVNFNKSWWQRMRERM
ncbi:hypothetical protein SAMN05421823_107126 [Catalinimonas alkaloidigena]|uniref:MotA/TolQ/ExbB proton channel family protein n=1 Tax=Catalinimonas alkaloidigena TaxID=1075417 RepID=A0A1G9LPE0_9BACT|nr:hypothetical protein [Catalinimonas alkaloidigena]SDL63909.1 hypothetical protein SAMN05421823_107126 [Catalinimonas alkaloidigena]